MPGGGPPGALVLVFPFTFGRRGFPQPASLENRVRNARGEQLDRSQRIVVAGDGNDVELMTLVLVSLPGAVMTRVIVMLVVTFGVTKFAV